MKEKMKHHSYFIQYIKTHTENSKTKNMENINNKNMCERQKKIKIKTNANQVNL
jgi:hypothetical protein